MHVLERSFSVFVIFMGFSLSDPVLECSLSIFAISPMIVMQIRASHTYAKVLCDFSLLFSKIH